MHFVMVGCGGVGGYFGGRLAQSGEQVTFIARGQQLASLNSKGLTIKSIAGDFTLSKVCTLDAESINAESLATPADIIFLAVKSYQLTSVIKQITPLIGKQTRVVPLLNGVNATAMLLELGVCAENLYGGLAKIISAKTADGEIHHTGAKPHITLGHLLNEKSLAGTDSREELHNRVSDETKRLGAIAKSLTLAGISVGVSTDIELSLWRKFIFVAAWGTLAAAKNLTLGEIRQQSHIAFLLERIVNEYAEIGRQIGVKLNDKHIKETLTFLSRLPDSSETSMQRDLANEVSSEFDILVEYPMQLVKKMNISAPVLTQCHQALLQNKS